MDKVVVSAAGRGTRMLHLTDDKPKHLIKVNGKPFLFYVLNNLSMAGYKEVVLVTGYKNELVEEFLKDYKFNGLKVSCLNQYDEFNPAEKYGTACPLMLKEIKSFVGKEQFLYICGDNFYSVDDLKSMNVSDGYNYVAGQENEHPENFGVILTEGEFLKEIAEKPKDFLGNVVNTSLYKFTPEIFKKILEIKKSSRGEYEITDAVSLLVKDKKVKVEMIKDFWMDFGRPEDIKTLSKILKNEGNKRK